MGDYRLFETEQFMKDLRRISRSGTPAVVSKLRSVVYPQLRNQPRYGPNIRKLRGYTPEAWRYRIGSWRFFYEIDEEEKIVCLIAAEHRAAAY